MRLLVHSNAPHTKTGYGVQTAQLVEMLHDAGHEVAVSCTYGQQGGMGSWRPPKPRHPELWPAGESIPLYQAGYEVNGVDVIHSHALHWFGGDPRGGWIIPLLDVWCLTPNSMLRDFNIAAWTPIDHVPVPRDVLAFFHRNPEAVPVAMSRFGERLLFDAGLAPVYVPLSVDTRSYRPTPALESGGRQVTGRQLMGGADPIPDGAFVVGMVAMNKGWSRDRKGFNEALRAFGQFWKDHPEAVLYVHADWSGQGMEGIDLRELAQHASIPPHAIRFPDLYSLRAGWTPEMMAAVYSDMDVLVSPSHGEGFCVPLIEAQACGTPVIASDFSAQSELVGAGWTVSGQLEWDPAQHSSYLCPSIAEVVARLEDAYQTDPGPLAQRAVGFAAQYDTARVFESCWLPFLASLEPAAPAEPKPLMDRVAVIVPAMRPENVLRLVSSFNATNHGSATLCIVVDEDFAAGAGRDLPNRICGHPAVVMSEKAFDARFVKLPGVPTSFAEKVNAGFAATDEDFVLVVGDDVEFTPGWLEAARKASEYADVIGTNDSEPGRVRNPDVAAGRHADHFFVRRSYVDEQGASLDGPGTLAPTAYRHWYTDKEIVGLAQARGVYVHADECRVIHHHPGYEGREDLRQADPVYTAAVEHSTADAETWRTRRPLVEMQRAGRGR